MAYLRKKSASQGYSACAFPLFVPTISCTALLDDPHTRVVEPPECPDSDSVAIGMRFRRMTAKRGFRGRATEGRSKCSATWDTEPSKSSYSSGCRVRCGENRYDVSFGRVADLLHPPPFSLSGSPFVRGAAERGRTSERRSCIRLPVIPFRHETRSRESVCSCGFLRIGTGVDCFCSDVEFVMSGYGTAIDYLFPVLVAVDPGYRTGRGGMPRSAASFPGAVTSG